MGRHFKANSKFWFAISYFYLNFICISLLFLLHDEVFAYWFNRVTAVFGYKIYQIIKTLAFLVAT